MPCDGDDSSLVVEESEMAIAGDHPDCGNNEESNRYQSGSR
jgi:hypothetical protein